MTLEQFSSRVAMGMPMRVGEIGKLLGYSTVQIRKWLDAGIVNVSRLAMPGSHRRVAVEDAWKLAKELRLVAPDALLPEAKPREIGTTLYRLRSSTGALLYVGVSESLIFRMSNHSSTKSWWREVVRIDLEHFRARKEALVAERHAIATERPLHNIQHRIETT